MAIGKTNIGGGGSGGTLTITAPANVTVTVSKDGKSKIKNSGASGVVAFKGLAGGKWTVTITGGGKTAKKTVTITTDYSTAISFNAIPEFTYTGDYKIVNDSDKPITVSQDNWKIRFLTSGTLKFTNLNGAEGGIDVFLVGGGGGGKPGTAKQYNAVALGGAGGAGGGIRTSKGITIQTGTNYAIVVGAGGSSGKNGGNSSAFGLTSSGGVSGKGGAGGDGRNTSPRAGSDGGFEWGRTSATQYSGAGGGGAGYYWFEGDIGTAVGSGAAGGKPGGGKGGNSHLRSPTSGSAGSGSNTGNGGGGGGAGGPSETSGGSGCSGIVIIRNKR